jgi:hypothetical protein
MKHCRNICDKFKAIIAGLILGLIAICVTSCNGQSRDVNHIPSVTEYLKQGYTPYLAFDEWSMRGGVMLWEVADSCDERIVLLKDEDSVVHVVRLGFILSPVLTYYKKDWGWYNRVVITGEDSCVYDRYILKDTIIELQIETHSDGKVFRNMYVKTRDKCTVSRLHNTCTWSGDELPQWHGMSAVRSTVYELGKGKKASYYLPSSFWDKPEYYLEYPAADTTIFSRSLGLGNGTLKHCKESGSLLEYGRDEDGIFKSAEVKPRCIGGQQALAKYIYRHSGPMIRKKIQNGGISINLCISDAGDVVKCELYGDYVDNSEKDKLEKQICREIPIKFEPATIFGHPVSCWYIIYIDPNDVGYHRKDSNEQIFVTHTLKSEFF